MAKQKLKRKQTSQYLQTCNLLRTLTRQEKQKTTENPNGKRFKKWMGKKTQQKKKDIKDMISVTVIRRRRSCFAFYPNNNNKRANINFADMSEFVLSFSSTESPNVPFMLLLTIFFAALRQTSRRITSGAHSARAHCSSNGCYENKHMTNALQEQSKYYFFDGFHLCASYDYKSSQLWFVYHEFYPWFTRSQVAKLFCIGRYFNFEIS